MSDVSRDQQQIENEISHGGYGPGAMDEPTVPRHEVAGTGDPRELSSTLDADIDPETLRNGGPTRTPGVMTTTGGNAGPNSVKPPSNRAAGVKIAPTTTGDATTGGMDLADGTSTSDASSNAVR